ncbi:MAG TPA: hypothetical protein GX004_01980 [Firmicutes bacterium]|jgi:hypothetical protein|nr:hypothetical protein [Bacillota bacterium]
MYPLTHIYFAKRVLGYLDDPTALGSIFPDMLILSGITWKESHTLGKQIWRFFRGKQSDLVNFSLGVITHGIEPKGLDYYSDEKYRHFERGYCFEKAKPLIDRVVDACNIASDDGWWKAHNFIEMGVELYINEKHPRLLISLQRAFYNVALIRKLCRELSPLLSRDAEILEKNFSTFKSFIDEEPLDAHLLALRYQRQIYFRHNIESIDLEESRDIIHKGKELVIDDIEDFFSEVKEEVRCVLDEVIKGNR